MATKRKFKLEDLPNLKFEEIQQIDPERLDIGTGLQDCAIIAQAFERATHSVPTEAAAFATLNRSLENTKVFANAASDVLKGYLKMPQSSASDAIREAQDFATQGASGVPIGGENASTDHIKQSFNFGDVQQSTYGSSFGSTLMKQLRDCIPCDLRIMAYLELSPNIDLLDALKSDVLNRLNALKDIARMLNSFDIYGDFCELLNLLSFMCIPDLQRIIAMLMALFMLQLSDLDGLIGFLQTLIAPLFMPLLMAITSLLDQFVLVVTNPLECIIDAINLQLKKLGFELDPNSPIEQLNASLSNGLGELNSMLNESKAKIIEKLSFYIDEVKALLGELGGGDSAYILASFKKLKIVRMVSFVKAIISALIKGHLACSSEGKPPEQQELDSFFENFLNPNSPFNLWIDDEGNLNIDEKVEGFVPTVQGLPNVGNVLEFEGIDLVDPTLAQTVENTSAALSEPARVVIPCKLEVTAKDAEKVNQFIRELNQS